MPGRLSPLLAAHAAPIPAQAGVGLRFPHHDHVLANPHAAAWLEVHPENYLGEGLAAEILSEVRRHYPLSLHATGLSLGSAGGIDDDHLAQIAQLCDRIAPGLVSDHLSWSIADGIYLPDLLPVPYTREALAVFSRNIQTVQNALGRALLIENPSVYLAFADCEMEEGEFLAALVHHTGCGILLDVNNLYVNLRNHGEDPLAALDAIMPGTVGEIHPAGHMVTPDAVIDHHGDRVAPEVWDLYERALQRFGNVSTLIEWDSEIPDWPVLRAEALAAQDILDRHGATGQVRDASE